MQPSKRIIYLEFWQECIFSGHESATVFLNKSITYGITVPSFLKFNKFTGEKAYVCINIQELLKPKHIASFEKGWPAGSNDPNVSNVWFRLWREVHATMEELPCWPGLQTPEVKFYPVSYMCHKTNEEKKTGYIVFDYSK